MGSGGRTALEAFHSSVHPGDACEPKSGRDFKTVSWCEGGRRGEGGGEMEVIPLDPSADFRTHSRSV